MKEINKIHTIFICIPGQSGAYYYRGSIYLGIIPRPAGADMTAVNLQHHSDKFMKLKAKGIKNWARNILG